MSAAQKALRNAHLAREAMGRGTLGVAIQLVTAAALEAGRAAAWARDTSTGIEAAMAATAVHEVAQQIAEAADSRMAVVLRAPEVTQ